MMFNTRQESTHAYTPASQDGTSEEGVEMVDHKADQTPKGDGEVDSSPMSDDISSPAAVSSPTADGSPKDFAIDTTHSGLKSTPLQVIFDRLGFEIRQEQPRQVIPGESKFQAMFKAKEYKQKVILHQVSGVFTPGRITAVMGASGSGKTSLLNLVAGQTSVLPQHSALSGRVLVNGEEMTLTDKRLKKICGYVQQDDVILATMTVREAITMAALLRLPRDMDHAAKLERVEQVIKLLHLEKCADSVIGSHQIKGISGGERKRVSVAMVMITNPSILYLDEPTSGLDAFTAYSIINTLRNVARAGRTVAATIHQPSSDIVHLFDDLILLSEGKIIYHGPMEHMVDYFAKLGFQCPKYSNPADYLFMSILNDGKKMAEQVDKKDQFAQRERLDMLAKAWPESEEIKTYVDAVVAAPTKGGVRTSDVMERAPFVTQFYLLSKRAIRNALRNKLMIRGRFAQSIVLSVIFGLIFLQLTSDQRGVQDRQGSLFMIATNGMMGSTMGVLSIFASEKTVFLREYQSGLYRLPAYFLSRTLVELPFKFVFPIISATIMYWMIGYQAIGAKYIVMVATLILVENCGTALGVFVASFFSDIAVALAILPVFLMPLMIFSGFVVNTSTIPVFLNWIKHLSPFKYAFVALARNEFEGLHLHCNADQYKIAPDGTKTCPFTNGSEVLALLGFDQQGSVTQNLLILLAMYFGLLCLAYIALWRQLKRTQ